ncbi:MAG: methyltransferase domain-containing protein [Candidatus Nanoarchaeia archaeon]|jgi:SAM-dependent methyltransferase
MRIKIITSLIKGNQKVLDLGDVNKSMLSNKLRENHEVTTVDIVKGADLKINLENGLRINEKYDCVVAGEVFEHIYKLRQLIDDIKRVLKPKGRLIVSVPNICNLKSRIKVFFGMLPSYCAHADDTESNVTGHIRDFNLKEITQLLKDSGFVVVKAYTNGLWLFGKQIIPGYLCRTEYGEQIVIEVVKSNLH